jgi:hypothetical protein
MAVGVAFRACGRPGAEDENPLERITAGNVSP